MRIHYCQHSNTPNQQFYTTIFSTWSNLQPFDPNKTIFTLIIFRNKTLILRVSHVMLSLFFFPPHSTHFFLTIFVRKAIWPCGNFGKNRSKNKCPPFIRRLTIGGSKRRGTRAVNGSRGMCPF